ncbi:MAG: single-stranded-DNA-specific exonuclease RecJ, partial [Bacillota bacterium]
YGLNVLAVKKIKKDYDPGLIITVDCGITSVKEVELAKSLNIDIIITDHHERAKELPKAVIINPTLSPQSTPYCGAGVSLKLAEHLTDKTFVGQFFDICAISTVADVVPLIKDNRIIVKLGLEMLSKGVCRPGLKKLMENAGIKKGKGLVCGDIAYKLAPRLNAAGRLASADNAVRLLVEDDPTAINMLSEELEGQNKKRQDIFAEVIKDALIQLEQYDLSRNLIIILQSDKWEEGVIGIAASKIAEQFGRPTILLTEKEGILKGSARSVSGVNIYEILSNAKELLIKFGGHPMAAGLNLERKNFERFLFLTNNYIENNIPKECFSKKILFDLEIDLATVKKDFINSVIKLEPFGLGNPKPVFLTKVDKMAFSPIKKHQHIKGKAGRLTVIGFNKKFALPLLNSSSEKYLSLTLDKDVYLNREVFQAKIKDFYANESSIENDFLLARYLEKFLCKGDRKPIIKSNPDKKYHFGVIYIAFTNRCFNEFIKNNDDVEPLFFNSSVMNPYNAVILSPDIEFDFTYYNTVVFLERPPQGYADLIKQRFCGTLEIIDKYPHFECECDYSTSKLREDYMFIFSNLRGLEFDDISYLFIRAQFFGYKKSLADFCVSFYILCELDLIILNKNGNIEVNNVKTDLQNSSILKLLSAGKIC